MKILPIGKLVKSVRIDISSRNVTFTSKQNIDKLDDTEYSNKTRTPFYDLRRCAVNVSPDGKKMLMFKQSRQGNVQY